MDPMNILLERPVLSFLAALSLALLSPLSRGRAAPPDARAGVMCPPPLSWPGQACPLPRPYGPAPGDGPLGQRISDVQRDLESLAAELRQQLSTLDENVRRLNNDCQRSAPAGAPGERGPQGPPGPPGPAPDLSGLAGRIAELQAKLDDKSRRFEQEIAALRLQLGSNSGPLRVRIEPVK
jgi:hypothetical protein